MMRVAAGQEWAQAQSDRSVRIENLVPHDRRVLAAWTADRFANANAAGHVLPDGKNAAVEARQQLEAARMDRADITIASELDAVDGFVELGDHNCALGARPRCSDEHAVIAPGVREADARARPAAEAIGVEPFERGG